MRRPPRRKKRRGNTDRTSDRPRRCFNITRTGLLFLCGRGARFLHRHALDAAARRLCRQYLLSFVLFCLVLFCLFKCPALCPVLHPVLCPALYPSLCVAHAARFDRKGKEPVPVRAPFVSAFVFRQTRLDRRVTGAVRRFFAAGVGPILFMVKPPPTIGPKKAKSCAIDVNSEKNLQILREKFTDSSRAVRISGSDHRDQRPHRPERG